MKEFVMYLFKRHRISINNSNKGLLTIINSKYTFMVSTDLTPFLFSVSGQLEQMQKYMREHNVIFKMIITLFIIH